jgi:hypothetical protein
MFIYGIKITSLSFFFLNMIRDDVTIPICDGLQLQLLDCTKYYTTLISADMGLKLEYV